MFTPQLLTRDQFREGVLSRDGHKCVLCDEPAVDAHHIMERRLWKDGGYYLENGASVCKKHHILCEQTNIYTDEVRNAAGIKHVVLPDHLYDDMEYDKWGNPMDKDSWHRFKGELFEDESVQKVLYQGGVLDRFITRVKYPRTYHLPWSPGINSDDRVMPTTDIFKNHRVIIHEKLDGENTTMYKDYIHARSLDSKNHPSRNWVKNFHSSIAHEIPDGWRICGENMYAEHSIQYNDLDTYLYGFSIWDSQNVCLSWSDTVEWFKLLNITPCPVVYDGIYDEDAIRKQLDNRDWTKHEGYVIRNEWAYHYRDYRQNVGKFVRKGHIQTTKHWMLGQEMKVNKLKETV